MGIIREIFRGTTVGGMGLNKDVVIRDRNGRIVNAHPSRYSKPDSAYNQRGNKGKR
jgi:hypothetical protein